jgi:phosphoglycolate phosphatase/AHBA synthesis associated protein
VGPEALLFDLDGVLVESDEVWFRVLNGVADELGYPAVSREAFLAATGQGIEADVERWYPDHSIAEIELRYADHFPRHLDAGTPMPGVADLFAELRELRLPTAVVTNTPNPLATQVVRHVGASPDHVVGGTDVPRSKPAPDIVLEACRRLDVAPARAWLVGDSRYDAEAAGAAGVRFVGFRRAGDLRIDRLADLLELL